MDTPHLRRLALSCLITTLLAWPVGATAQAGEPESPSGSDPQDAIVVTGHALRDMGLMAGSVELQGDDLLRLATPQIGEMLAHLPGVSATSFAPGVSRPVLRGQTGDRVLVLIDGIGSIDVSSVSADHGVALDALTIDHVDVLHGPAVLAYGGQAIGGAVVAYDRRIPRKMPEDGFDLTATTGYSSATRGKSSAGSVDVALGQGLVGHLDASWHEDSDLRTGGTLVSEALGAELLANATALRLAGDTAGADDLDAARTASGKVPNSYARGTAFGAGLAWIGSDASSLGLSVQRLDNRYGIPARPGGGEDGVSIDLGQTRIDLRGRQPATARRRRNLPGLPERGGRRGTGRFGNCRA